MEGKRMIWIFVGQVLEQERAGGYGALWGGEEVHFVEETCTQGLCPCSLMAVAFVKL
jgi:hypothetical protein